MVWPYYLQPLYLGTLFFSLNASSIVSASTYSYLTILSTSASDKALSDFKAFLFLFLLMCISSFIF